MLNDDNAGDKTTISNEDIVKDEVTNDDETNKKTNSIDITKDIPHFIRLNQIDKKYTFNDGHIQTYMCSLNLGVYNKAKTPKITKLIVSIIRETSKYLEQKRDKYKIDDAYINMSDAVIATIASNIYKYIIRTDEEANKKTTVSEFYILTCCKDAASSKNTYDLSNVDISDIIKADEEVDNNNISTEDNVFNRDYNIIDLLYDPDLVNEITESDGKYKYRHIDANKFAYFLMNKYHTVSVSLSNNRRIVYYYDKKSGIYKEDDQIKQGITHIICKLPENHKDVIVNEKDSVRRTKIENTYKHIKDFNEIKQSDFNKYNGIPVQNGVLVFENNDLQLIDYDHEMLFNYKLNVTYDPTVLTPENKSYVINILKSWLQDTDDEKDRYEYILQIIAQALDQHLPNVTVYKKFYIAFGPSNTGKSTCLDILKRIFDGLYCEVALQDINSNNRFAFAPFENKYINPCDETPHIRLPDVEKIKKITGTRNIPMEKKFQDQYQSDITAVNVFACNSLPLLSSQIVTDEAFWKRVILLPFNNVVHYNDTGNDNWAETHLKDQFYTILFALAVEVWKEIHKNHELKHYQHWKDVRNMWVLDMSNMINKFEEDTLELTYNKNDVIEKSILEDVFYKWLSEHAAEYNINTTNINEIKQKYCKPSDLRDMLARLGLYEKNDFTNGHIRVYCNVLFTQEAKAQYSKIIERNRYMVTW